MLDEEKLRKAVQLLVEAAAPRKIILFGSYARGQANEWSDFDFLVLKEKVVSRRRETAQLLRALEPYRIHADVIVVGFDTFEEWKDVPGTVLYEANQEGRIVYEAA